MTTPDEAERLSREWLPCTQECLERHKRPHHWLDCPASHQNKVAAGLRAILAERDERIAELTRLAYESPPDSGEPVTWQYLCEDTERVLDETRSARERALIERDAARAQLAALRRKLEIDSEPCRSEEMPSERNIERGRYARELLTFLDKPEELA